MVEKSVSKAEGMKQLCSYFGVPLSCTVAFGDSMNDLEILQEAGIGNGLCLQGAFYKYLQGRIQKIVGMAGYKILPNNGEGWNVLWHKIMI